MDSVFNHKQFESEIYKKWEESGAFTPTIVHGKKPFTIIMPPPNANDPLHIGHAREVSTQDILTRYHRMKGEPTLWLPGADHAGIETQYVFEKRLSEKGHSRFDYDRETLYKLIWDYVHSNMTIMRDQLKSLGASCDWTRFKFTLDPEIVNIVYKSFKKLYDEGLVYRGERIVNYCPKCGTAYSQLEVDYVEKEDNLYFLDYGSITIATTRPETIFADVAIAINQKDKRYSKLIGITAYIPLINRAVPIIADHLVDPKFGTGALKVTPAHDAVDFEIGTKHALPRISVIDERGRMVNTPPKYIGMKASAARETIVKDLEIEKKLIKTEKIKHMVGTCYRCKNTIEPMISKQWYLSTESMAKAAIKAIKDKKTVFTAKKFEKIAIHWLKNLKDWNISRQIVWGIRIPAYRCNKCLEWSITEGQAPEICESCKHTELTQDSDTFDTWFSSGQWPFATLKTTKKGDFEYFYPTSVMDPSYDILPFWVIRMLLLGINLTGDVPFKEVLLHGLVRDKFGVKISKSKGNVIDPNEMTDKYGADALRMALIWGSLVENDSSLSEENIRGQRNFANKVWNIARFVISQREFVTSSTKSTTNEDDKQIKRELRVSVKKITKSLDKHRLNEAAEEIYDFIWHKFADSYLEKTKNRNGEAQKTLEQVLNTCLLILHPFMPYVTEAIWEQTKFSSTQLISSSWPTK